MLKFKADNIRIIRGVGCGTQFSAKQKDTLHILISWKMILIVTYIYLKRNGKQEKQRDTYIFLKISLEDKHNG